MPHPKLKDRAQAFVNYVKGLKKHDQYPYFRPVSRSWGTEVEVEGRRLIMIGSNDYLGLSHDPRVMEAAEQAIRRWGTGAGGSRFLCGNLTLHEELEERLADLVGKKKALVHVTGFSTNLGVIASLLTAHDIILCDRENHASIFEGCKASRAQVIPFTHNDVDSATRKLDGARQKNPQGLAVLITEGVFSMSGDMAPLPDFVQLKTSHPDLLIYLDDAHGLGVMGPQGRGTVAHFGLTEQVDFNMGTFSKALASVGGFSAGVRVMHAQSHDNDYAARRELHNAYYFLREGLPLIYTDGYQQSEAGPGETPFPRHAHAPFLGTSFEDRFA